MIELIPIDAVWPGRPHPRGATWDGHGVNFALFSEQAEAVELCLFDRRGRECQRIPLREQTDHVWHCYLPQARPGLVYGYRVHGPYRPQDGQRFNPHKLLIDPYARDFIGRLRWNDALYGYTVGHRKADLSFDRRDSAAYMPKCRVLEAAFSWGDDRRPDVPWHEMVIYEMHVKGYTMRHPRVPEPLRGTYAGLSTAAAIDHLRRLGVTTVELMPVHAFLNDRHLAERQLQNYWGYNTLGFFAPEPRYASAQAVQEFKTMVRTLHAAGIEVILDVVYNHSCEGNQLGPTLSMRGVDNAAYYVLADDRRYYVDVTGCGNTLNTEHPRVLQLVMDSLRYWVEEMHVDGFRFDLASALARERGRVDQLGGFFDAVRQDPTLNAVKLIAEPWDLGHDGYQVGQFPLGWAEWNDRYRDGMRAFWKGDEGQLGEFARRLTGSSDLYGSSGRRPNASVNFIAAHDGFTLHDLVSYNDKHNEANGEDNLDGHNHNLSWNCGVEGPTDDPAVLGAARAPETQPAGHAAAVTGRADAAVRRRAGPHPAGQQQRLCAGQRDQLARLEPAGAGAAGRLRGAADRAAARASDLQARRFLRWPARRPHARRALAASRRVRHERVAVARPAGALRGHVHRRTCAARHRPPWPAADRRPFPAALQRPP